MNESSMRLPTSYLGIDPGLDGAVCRIVDGGEVTAEVVPTIRQAGSKSKRLYDIRAMVQMLVDWGPDIVMAALEKGRAGRGQGVVSMFSFGKGCGLWEGMLAMAHIPYVIVHPNTWQKAICVGLSGDVKARAVQAASSMLPELDLHRSDHPLCKGPHQGKADAACIALYARKVYLGRTA